MTGIGTLTASQRIARFSRRLSPAMLAAADFHQVGRALIDTVGVTLAGHDEPAARAVWSYVARRRGNADGAATGGQVRAWGRAGGFPVEDAALYNGVAGHVLDYDDVSSPLRGHPSIALLPALVSLAQERNVDGTRLASAYVVGFEVMVRLARAMVREHYAKGWHATTTLGVIAGAVACSHLLGLSERRTVNAIGLAVAQAAGTRGNFGTMAKSFQAGHCSASAARAAVLAELDIDAAEDALDGGQGFARLYGGGEDLAQALNGLETAGMPGGDAFELRRSGIEVKKYPMCYAAHRAIDGMLDLRAEHGLRAESVERIHVRANRRALVPLIHDRPRTGLEAKFSMQYAMAAAVLDGHVGLSSFTDDAVSRSEIQALIARTTCEEDQGPDLPRWNVVEITHKSAPPLTRRVSDLRGSSSLPLTDEELRRKWRDCLAYAGMEGQGDDFFRAALRLETVSVREIFQTLPALPARAGCAAQGRG
ncbi:MmgE/PrpD family protein [Bordetella genomosp. 10]|uniref:MmgE/PrpD family protein n=1 Tax=Bordetella genomosp. 10 TaxID=1416804 RepID=UPI000B9E1A16|nr:MmgE/PrpD family protein [Bordetella genomosp. 10]